MSRNPPSKDKLERSQFSVNEPLTSEMKTKIRSELTRSHHSFRKSVYGLETKPHWASDLGPDTGMFIHNNPITPLDDWTLQKFCNKPAALYWARPAQINERCPRLTFACICKQWFRSHNNDPNTEFGHFFANPIWISSTGPETIAGIFEAHKSLCDQAASLLNIIRRGEAGEFRLGSQPDPRNCRLLPLY